MNRITTALITYSALLAGGGLFGYLKAGSLPSLIMSSIFAVLVLFSIYLNKEYSVIGYKATYGILAFLSAFFIFRTVVTGKFMPSGMLAILTLAVIVFMLLSSREVARG